MSPLSEAPSSPNPVLGKIQVNGANRTKPDFLHKILEPCLHSTSISHLATELHHALLRLDRLQLFSSIDIKMIDQESKDGDVAKGENGAAPNGPSMMIFEVQEKRCRMSAGTEVQAKGQIGMALSAHLFNIGGRGEQVEVKASWLKNEGNILPRPTASATVQMGDLASTIDDNTATSQKPPLPFGGSMVNRLLTRASQLPSPILSVIFSKPIDGDPDKLLKASIFAFDKPLLRTSLYEYQRGATVSYSHLLNPLLEKESNLQMLPLVQSTWTLKSMWRHLVPTLVLTPSHNAVSFMSPNESILRRTSVQHQLTVDARDDPILPITGYLLRLTNELASGFWKSEIGLYAAVPLWKRLVSASSTFRVGYLLSDKKAVADAPFDPLLADKFRAGGPTSIRGYDQDALGPINAYGDLLGGRVLLESGLGLALALRPQLIRLHTFINAGLLGESFDELTTDSSVPKSPGYVSIGAGLAAKIGNNARIEANLVSRRLDSIGVGSSSAQWARQFDAPTLQVGIGVDFL